MNREAVYSALFDKLQTVPGFATYSRRLRHWEEVPEYEQPALFLSPVEERVEPQTAAGSRYFMRANVYVYVHDDDAPSQELNRLLDALIGCLNAPHPVSGTSSLPLDGVRYCRAAGTVEMDEGLFGAQAFAVVPVEILVTESA